MTGGEVAQEGMDEKRGSKGSSLRPLSRWDSSGKRREFW